MDSQCQVPKPMPVAGSVSPMLPADSTGLWGNSTCVPTSLLGEQPAQLAEHPGQVPDRDAASVASNSLLRESQHCAELAVRSTVSLPQGYSQREVGPPPMPQVQGRRTAPEERDTTSHGCRRFSLPGTSFTVGGRLNRTAPNVPYCPLLPQELWGGTSHHPSPEPLPCCSPWGAQPSPCDCPPLPRSTRGALGTHRLSPAAAGQAPGPSVLWGPCCAPVPALQQLPWEPLTNTREDKGLG